MPSRKHWLDVSARMFQQLVPPEIRELGDAGDAAGLPDVEAARVDDALIAMALAHGPEQLPSLIAPLERATLTALCRRWTHCATQWAAAATDAMPGRFPWIPAQKPDVWRAVLIAMVEAKMRAQHARHVLWPAWFDSE